MLLSQCLQLSNIPAIYKADLAGTSILFNIHMLFLDRKKKKFAYTHVDKNYGKLKFMLIFFPQKIGLDISCELSLRRQFA